MEASSVQYVSVGFSAASQSHRLGTGNLNSTAAAELKATHDQFARKSSIENAGSGPSDSNEKKKGQASHQESTINETIKILLDHHIVENRKLLNESWVNLDKIADYCEANYLQSERKDIALEETKNYTTRSLASVSNQIHNFASNLLTLFDLQLNGINELETRSNSLGSAIRFHEERAYRREIGKLTKPKLLPVSGAPKVIKPLYPEKYEAKKRRSNYYSTSSSGAARQDSLGNSSSTGSTVGGSIDYSILDDIGEAHKVFERRGVHAIAKGSVANIYNSGNGYAPPGAAVSSGGLISGGTAAMTGSLIASGQSSLSGSGMAAQRHWMPPVKSATLRPSKSSNLSAALSAYPNGPSGDKASTLSSRTPAPTVRPPTPPLGTSGACSSATMSRFSSLSRNAGALGAGSSSGGSKDYRSLGLVVAPPQLPNNYNNYQSTSTLQQQQHNQLQTQQPSTVQSKKTTSAAVPIQQPKTSTLQPSSEASQPYRSPSTNPFLADFQGESSTTPSNVTNPSKSVPQTAAANLWVPTSYLQKVVALYDYNADKDDELTFKESSVIYVTAKNDDGWWEGVMNGITGLFPGNYVEPCP